MPKQLEEVDWEKDEEERIAMEKELETEEEEYRARKIAPARTERTERIPPRRNLPELPKKPQDKTFVQFHMPAREGIAYKETGEPVGEDYLSLFAEILERLERIETKMGSI